MNRRFLTITATIVAILTPVALLAQTWTGAPATNPPGQNAKGPVWLQAVGAAVPQTGDFSVSKGTMTSAQVNGVANITGLTTVGNDVKFTSGYALKADSAGATLINAGNWGSGATAFTLGVYGDINVQGFGGANGTLSVTQICLKNDTCRTTWPTAGAGAYVRLSGDDSKSGQLTVANTLDNGNTISGTNTSVNNPVGGFFNVSTVPGSGGMGVKGRGERGVYGYGGTIGVQGDGSSYGVKGTCTTTPCDGVQGIGGTFGVFGQAGTSNGSGFGGYFNGLGTETGVYGTGLIGVNGNGPTGGVFTGAGLGLQVVASNVGSGNGIITSGDTAIKAQGARIAGTFFTPAVSPLVTTYVADSISQTGIYTSTTNATYTGIKVTGAGNGVDVTAGASYTAYKGTGGITGANITGGDLGVLGNGTSFISKGVQGQGFIGVAGYANVATPNTIGVFGAARNADASSIGGFFQGPVGVGVNGTNNVSIGQQTAAITANGHIYSVLPSTNIVSSVDGSNTSGITIAGSTDRVRLQMGVGSNTLGPYAGWIQASYDNGGGANGTEPLLLNPLGGNVGIGLTAPTYRLQLGVDSAAKPGSNTWTISSDGRLKDVQGPFTRGLEAVEQINPVYFNYKEGNALDLPSDKTYVGVVAQEVKDLVPEAISKDSKGYYTMNSDAITWAMLNAIKELKAENDALKARVEALEKK